MSMPGPEDAMQVSALPESLVLDYLAEGAANVVYRLSFPEPPGQHGTGASTAAGSMTPGDGAEEDPHNGSIVDNQRSGASPAARGDWTRFQNRVLRLRKAVSAGVPIAISARSHGEVFQPLFPPGSLLDQDLVRMPSTIVSRCNARLREDERSGERPDKRHGVYLAEDEAYGILLTDMTPGTEGDGLRGACEQDAASALDADDPQRPPRRRCRTREVLVEFKSKWLVQSPSAPAGATRCRTCALRAQHNAVRRRQGQQPERSFCPLDLVSVDKARVDRAVRGVFDQNRRQQRQRQQRRQDVSPLFDELPDELPDNSLQERVVRFLHRHPLLLRLRQLQVELDQRGPAHAGLMPSSSSSSSSSSSALAAASSGDFVGAVTGTETNALERDFLIAMTLRDCTVFLKISIAEHDEAGAAAEQGEIHPSNSNDDDDGDDDDGPCITNENDMDLRPEGSNDTNDVGEKAQSKGDEETNEETMEGQGAMTIRLGDLDLKSPSGGKWSYWRGTEQTLIDEGWYFHSCDGE